MAEYIDYINREAAIKAANEGADIWDGGSNKGRYKHISDALNAVPAADVAPVKHGRWVVSRTDRAWNGAEYPTHCKCNQCGREIPYLDMDAYCPTCGAKMDKDGDGE